MYPPSGMNQSSFSGKTTKPGWRNQRSYSVDGNYRPSPRTRQQQNISMRRQENVQWVSELSQVEEKEHWQEQIDQLKKQLEFSTNICQTLMRDQQHGNQGKHRVTKRGPALSYPMFTLVTSEDIAGSSLSYLLQSLFTNPYSVMPSSVGTPQVHLIMHQLNQCYTQLNWQQNNVLRLKQMLSDMCQQQEHFQQNSQQRQERSSSAPPPSTPNVFNNFSFLPPPMNVFNMPPFGSFPNMMPGMNFNLNPPGIGDFNPNSASQPDTPLQPPDPNTSGKTEYMAFPKPFESNAASTADVQRTTPKASNDGEHTRGHRLENHNKDQGKTSPFLDPGHSDFVNSVEQLRPYDEESAESMSTMPDPEDPTTVTKTFKSRKASAQASLASKDKTPKTKSKKRKVFHQKSKGLKNQDLHCVSISSTKKPKESSNKHAQTEGVTEASASCDHIARLRKDNRTAEVSSEAGSDFSVFEALRDTIYSEVATLISQNECRPHFLIELFHELQLLNTDYLRQKALFALQDIVTRRVTDATDQNHDSTKPIESIGWMASNSELTPSESLATTDDEMFTKDPNGPTCNEGDQNEGDNLSNLSTSSNFEPFATDDLGNTVIHLDQALARMREYERMKLESENNLAADSCNNLNIAATNLEVTYFACSSCNSKLPSGQSSPLCQSCSNPIVPTAQDPPAVPPESDPPPIPGWTASLSQSVADLTRVSQTLVSALDRLPLQTPAVASGSQEPPPEPSLICHKRSRQERRSESSSRSISPHGPHPRLVSHRSSSPESGEALSDAPSEDISELDPNQIATMSETVQNLIGAINQTCGIKDPSTEPADQAVSFRRAKPPSKFFAPHPELDEILSRERENPTRRFQRGKRLGVLYPFSPELTANWTVSPSVDPPVSRLSTNTRLQRLCPAFASTWASKSISKWAKDLRRGILDGAPPAQLAELANQISHAGEYLVSASLDVASCAAQASSNAVAIRRTVWLKAWQADLSSKKSLTSLPFQGSRLFGSQLDQIIKDATGGTSSLLPQAKPRRPPPRRQFRSFRPFRRFAASSSFSQQQQRPQARQEKKAVSFRPTPSWRPRFSQAIASLLKSGVIVPVPEIKRFTGFYSNLFVVPKKDGKARPILDLKLLNRRVRLRHFWMESLRSVIASMEAQEFLCSIDIQDAYLHVPIFPGHHRFLRFAVQRDHFQFVALPFGLATAPRAFTKIMAALMAILRVRGLVLFPYLDDILIKAPSFAQAHESLSIVLDTLARFGWLVNRKKSCLIPSQRIIFLGMLFDTRQSRVFLPKDKRSTLCRDIRLLQGPQPPSVRP
ncbi:unnamed protein product [Ranitomeya imitator]|uniref:ribonuclease H n=1 Tax=Ranitomeya imitator TaxID=111125 RepID=A0ABN9KUI3_9NEOB|nr:unnamed protein product [Ranitomeya imitator]